MIDIDALRRRIAAGMTSEADAAAFEQIRTDEYRDGYDMGRAYAGGFTHIEAVILAALGVAGGYFAAQVFAPAAVVCGVWT